MYRMPIKNCLTCHIEMECHFNTKYCEKCKVLKNRELKKTYRRRERNLSKNKALIEIDITNEKFKTINEYENYEISNCGRVFSKKSNKFLKLSVSSYGYIEINLCKNGKRKLFRVHRLVALHFIENPNDYKMIDHINRIKTDNRISNLQWVNHKMNMNNMSLVINRKGFITVVKNGNKKYRAFYYDKDLTDKKKRSKYFYTKDEAKEFLNSC